MNWPLIISLVFIIVVCGFGALFIGSVMLNRRQQDDLDAIKRIRKVDKK